MLVEKPCQRSQSIKGKKVLVYSKSRTHQLCSISICDMKLWSIHYCITVGEHVDGGLHVCYFMHGMIKHLYLSFSRPLFCHTTTTKFYLMVNHLKTIHTICCKCSNSFFLKKQKACQNYSVNL